MRTPAARASAGSLVRVDDAQLEQRVAPRHHFEHFLHAPAVGVLPAVEVGEAHRLLQLVHDAMALRCDGVKTLLASEVDVQVVQHERDVGEHRDRHRRDDHHDVEGERRRAPRRVCSGRRSPIQNSSPTATSQPTNQATAPRSIAPCSIGVSAAPARASPGTEPAAWCSRRIRNRRVYIAPVANGVKRASSDRLISMRSSASGIIAASVSIIHSRNEIPIVTMAATIWFEVSAEISEPERHESAREQEQTEVTAVDRPPFRRAEDAEHDCIGAGQRDHRQHAPPCSPDTSPAPRGSRAPAR